MTSQVSVFPTDHSLPRDLAEPLIRIAPRLGTFGSRIMWYPGIGSTNDVAATLADAGADEGLVVIAEAQTSGRGRLGRSWASPAGAGIYATVILRPEAHFVPLLTLAAGVAIAEGIQAATGLSPAVKWPNDVFIAGRNGPAWGRKVAGILAEGGGAASGSPWVVLGFGINVLPAAYPPDVASRATSLESELGRPVERGLVFAECLAALATRHGDLRDGRGASVVSAWRSRAASTFGRRVEWEAEGVPQHGIALEIDVDGALLVRTDSGVTRLIAGEVRWI